MKGSKDLNFEMDGFEEEVSEITKVDEFANLSAEEQNRLLEYNESLVEFEKARGRRILFSRAPKETLPFIVYCIFVAANALFATFLLISQSTGVLAYYLLVAGAMILPILVMPGDSISSPIALLRSYRNR